MAHNCQCRMYWLVDIKQRHISKDLVRVTNILMWNQQMDIWWFFVRTKITCLHLLCVRSVLPVNICSIYFQFKNVGQGQAENSTQLKSWFFFCWWEYLPSIVAIWNNDGLLKGGYPIIVASNVFSNSHLIQKCIQNQQQLLILYTFLNRMRVGKNIRHKDNRMNSL